MGWLRRVCCRIYDGSIVIGWRVARWPWERVEFWSRLRRVVWLGFLAWGTWRLTGAYPRFTALLIAGWLIAAYRAVGTPAASASIETSEVDDEEDGEDVLVDPKQVREVLLRSIRTAIGTATGVHLAVVLAAWQRAGMAEPGLSLSEFRTIVEGCGVPVRDSLKRDGRTRIGIHRDDLPRPTSHWAPDLTAPPPPTDGSAPF